MRSLNGILKTRRNGSIDNWTSQVVAGTWSGVAYGNGTWVIVGSNNSIAYNSGNPYSAWTAAVSPLNVGANFRNVVFAQGYFVALGYSDSDHIFAVDIITSPDGINWTKNGSSTNSYVGRGIATDGTKIIINAQPLTGSTAMYTFSATIPTGAWAINSHTVPKASNNAHPINYAGGYWMYTYALVEGGSGFSYSADGSTWSSFLNIYPIFPADSNLFIYDGSKWISTPGQYYYLSNGPFTSWSCRQYILSTSPTIKITAMDMEYGNGKIVIVGHPNSGDRGIVYYDGVLTCGNYFTTVSTVLGSFYGVHYNGNYWVAAGYNIVAVAGPGL